MSCEYSSYNGLVDNMARAISRLADIRSKLLAAQHCARGFPPLAYMDFHLANLVEHTEEIQGLLKDLHSEATNSTDDDDDWMEVDE